MRLKTIALFIFAAAAIGLSTARPAARAFSADMATGAPPAPLATESPRAAGMIFSVILKPQVLTTHCRIDTPTITVYDDKNAALMGIFSSRSTASFKGWNVTVTLLDSNNDPIGDPVEFKDPNASISPGYNYLFDHESSGADGTHRPKSARIVAEQC